MKRSKGDYIQVLASRYAKAFSKRLKVDQQVAEFRLRRLLGNIRDCLRVGASLDLLGGSGDARSGQVLVTRVTEDKLAIEWKPAKPARKAFITGSSRVRR